MTILSLPPEIIASIFRNVDNVHSLPAALLTCRYMYKSFKAYPSVAADIIKRQIAPSVLPYLVAVMRTSTLPQPRTSTDVSDLLNALYNTPALLVAKISSMALTDLLKMVSTHEIIQDMTVNFAREAWDLLEAADPRLKIKLDLSLRENERFSRAFYRVELFYRLFRSEAVGKPGQVDNTVILEYLSRHPPWENEQLGCVHDFLERRLTRASFDVVAHDVQFGELSVDYLSSGGENHWKQLWLSQGIHFIHRLLNNKSYDYRDKLLKSAQSLGSANLPDALVELGDDCAYDDTILQDYTEDMMAALRAQYDSQDPDQGPYLAWRATHECLPRSAWVMFSENSGLRECAYVLWDCDRVYGCRLLDIFPEIPSAKSHMFTDEEYEEMVHSFEERSRLWQKGGSGFWSKGDASKISWPNGTAQTSPVQ